MYMYCNTVERTHGHVVQGLSIACPRVVAYIKGCMELAGGPSIPCVVQVGRLGRKLSCTIYQVTNFVLTKYILTDNIMLYQALTRYKHPGYNEMKIEIPIGRTTSRDVTE